MHYAPLHGHYVFTWILDPSALQAPEVVKIVPPDYCRDAFKEILVACVRLFPLILKIS